MSKFLCSSSALLRCLKQVAVVVRRSAIVPILENVLLSVSGNALTVTGGDLENYVSVQLPIENVSGEAFHICPPLKPLLDVLSALPDQPITVALGPKDGQLTIKAVTASSEEEGQHGGAKYTVACEAASDYPKTPSHRTQVQITLTGHLLRAALGYTSELVSNDELRPAMTCLCIVAQTEGIDFIATDGHRLCLYEVKASKEPGYAYEGEASKTLLIPRAALKALKHLVKNDDVVTLSTGTSGDAYVHFQIGTYGASLTVRPVDERFPDIYNVLPTEFPYGVLTLNRPAAKSMLTRLKPFCETATKRVHLHPASGVARGFDTSFDMEAQEPLPGTYSGGDLKEIAFNINFLAHIFNLLPGPRVRMHFEKQNGKCLITSDACDGLQYLQMPVMVQDYSQV